MELNTLALFPVIIKYFNLFYPQKECLQIVEETRELVKQQHKERDVLTNSKSNFDLNTKALDLYPKLKKSIIDQIHLYENELGLYNSVLKNSWINFQLENSKLSKHTHPCSQISGVLYLKVDPESTPIYFYNPNPYNSILDKKEHNTNNCEFYYFKPNIGDLILFPSWLSHGSNENKSLSKERVSLSFNSG